MRAVQQVLDLAVGPKDLGAGLSDDGLPLHPQNTGGGFIKGRHGRLFVESNDAAGDATKNVLIVAFDLLRASFRLRAQPDQFQLFLSQTLYDIVERFDHHTRAVSFALWLLRRLTFVRPPMA